MKTLLLFLSLFVVSSQAATVRLYFVDPLTNDKDTNAFYITPVGTNVLSNGGVVGRGIATRYVPASDGYRTNTLAVGHYSITNRSLGSGVVIRVPESSSLYDYTNLLISGYNIFVTVTNGESGSGTSGALTNSDSRNIHFAGTLELGTNSNSNILTPNSGSLSLSQSLIVSGASISGGRFISTNFTGNGEGITNLPVTVAAGTNIVTVTNSGLVTVHGTANVTQSGLAAGSYAQRSAIFIYGTNGTTRNFSNNIITAFASLTSGDRLILPEGDFTIGTNNLVVNAPDVAIKGSGTTTRIISWCAGPAIIPGTNGTTIEDLHVTYDWFSLQNYLVETEEESLSQGIGTPTPNVALFYHGNESLAYRSITNLTLNRVTLTSQADCVAVSSSNSILNFVANNCVFNYAWDCFVNVTGDTNEARLNNCVFNYINAGFTNISGSVLGTAPRVLRAGSNQRYIFNNCSGVQHAAVVQLWDDTSPSKTEVYGGSWDAYSPVLPYVFNPNDIKGYTTVAGKFYSTEDSYTKTNSAPVNNINPTLWPTQGQLRTNTNQRAFANIQFSMTTDLLPGQSDITVTRWLIGSRTNFTIISIADEAGGVQKYSQVCFLLSPGEIWQWSSTDTGDVIEVRISEGVDTSNINGI